ncbi:MAG: hypothetical protein PVI07_18895 [Anaerolineae bacterium]|jgi:hypothetical protein
MENLARDRVYGADFSGAKDAGKRIWIAAGTISAETLEIETCRPAKDLPGSSKEREQALRALRELIANEHRSAIGLDFPFGLPRELVGHEDWESFVRAFPDDHPGPEAFREACRKAAEGRELRRHTDEAARTPFSPYNIRLYRQTYYGIRDLLHPLVWNDQVCVLPMQEPVRDKPWLLEICPASTLKHKGLYMPYKGKAEMSQFARESILRMLERKRIVIQEQTLRATIVDDAGGDALDSVIAALATFEALCAPPSPDPRENDIYAVEGYVYFGHAG